MSELVFLSVRKITLADWLLNGLIFYGIGPVQYSFLLQTGAFWREYIRDKEN